MHHFIWRRCIAVVVEQVTYTVLQRLAAGVHDIDAVAALVVVRNRSGHNVTVSLSDAVRHEDKTNRLCVSKA